MIKVHPSACIPARWIGVDLNTTGHAAVAADPDSGKILKLGKNAHYVRSNSIKNCTKLYKEGKLWKLKKVKSRERRAFKAALNKISRQIVSFAESLGSGIKFEKLLQPLLALPRCCGFYRVLVWERIILFAPAAGGKEGIKAGYPCHLREPGLYVKTMQPVREYRAAEQETVRVPALRVCRTCGCECRLQHSAFLPQVCHDE